MRCLYESVKEVPWWESYRKELSDMSWVIFRSWEWASQDRKLFTKSQIFRSCSSRVREPISAIMIIMKKKMPQRAFAYWFFMQMPTRQQQWRVLNITRDARQLNCWAILIGPFYPNMDARSILIAHWRCPLAIVHLPWVFLPHSGKNGIRPKIALFP